MELLYWFFEMGASFVEGYMFLVLTGTLLRERRTKEVRLKEILIAAVQMVIVILINSVKLYSAFSGLAMFVVLIGGQCLFLKRNIIKSCIAFLAYFMGIAVIDYIILLLMERIYEMPTGIMMEKLGYERLQALVLSKSILIIVVEVIRHFAFDFRKIKMPQNKLVIVALAALSITPLVQLGEYRKNGYTGIGGFWGNFVCITGVIVIIKYLFKDSERQEKEIELQVQEAKNELLEDSLQEIEESFDIWRKSVHDYKHAILYMDMLVRDNRIEELQKYLVSENEKIEQSSHYYKTGNGMLDVILNTKLQEARDKKIKFSAHVNISPEIFVSEEDLGRLLGNLLDNALEAAQQSEKPYIIFSIEEEQEVLEIEIVNSYDVHQKVDFQTTKEDKAFHGIGLQSVEEIVERYEGKLYREVEEDEVIVKVVLLKSGFE